MMKKTIDSPFRKLKMLAVLPVAAFIFYAFATPDYRFEEGNTAISPEVTSIDVKGQVLKSDGTPLPGTSVILKGSTLGTMSGPEGKFELKGVPSDGELFFSFVGFKTNVQKASKKPMKIVMEISKVGIEQITVVGYGTPPPPPPPPPPFSIISKSMDGPNSPLFILDGFPIDKKAMEQINPNDIQSISVLKDQSATAVYGDIGKYGVILITSKKEALKKIDPAKPPLYIIDGEETDKMTADRLNPSTIDKVSILKDATLIASYGEKGKNGVVIIFTKEYSLKNPDKVKEAMRKMLKPVQREDGVYVVVEHMPEFPGGEMALRKFIGENIKYPVEAKDKNIQGKVFVTFVVNSNGKTEKAKIARGVDPLLDTEALRVVSSLPDWKPGMQDGKAVSVSYTVPINFALDGKKPGEQINTPNTGEDQVFVVVEEMPEFPGGEAGLRKFIAESIKYPAEAKEKGIQGKVFVTFVVSKMGKVERAKIARGVDPLLDTEALRVVSLLPDWKPGKQRGVEVNVSYTIPINFALDGGKDVKPTNTFVPEKTDNKVEKEVFIVVEEMPEYPGGSDELRRFLAKNVKYPAEAQKAKTQGKVFVSFIVNAQGKVEQPKIEKSVDPALDAEAIRVVGLMPDWKPGKQRGVAVSVSYTIPIQFMLQ